MLWFLNHKAKIPSFRARAVKAIQIVLKVSMFIYLTNILRIFMTTLTNKSFIGGRKKIQLILDFSCQLYIICSKSYM